MKQTKLHMTIILCHKLKNRVGQGSVSPYQVSIAPGNFVGRSGQIVEPASSLASNQEFVVTRQAFRQSWLNRILASFSSNQS